MADVPAKHDQDDQGAGGSSGGSPGGSGGIDYKALYEAELAAHEKTKAESRKWEGRAKADGSKARKLEELGGDDIEARIAALEADKKALEAEKERSRVVSKVAKATGVDASIVGMLGGADEESLTAQAKAIADAYKAPGGAPRVPEAGKFPGAPGKGPDEEKRRFVRELLGNK